MGQVQKKDTLQYIRGRNDGKLREVFPLPLTKKGRFVVCDLRGQHGLVRQVINMDRIQKLTLSQNEELASQVVRL